MKSIKLLPACFAFGISLLNLSVAAHAEEVANEDHSSNFAIGFDIDSYANNYGMGVTLASPRFFNDHADIQVTADIAWAQGLENGDSKSNWEHYGLFKIGYFAGRFLEGLPIRVYGGGGVVFLTPSSSLSSDSVDVGGYGLAGLEFFVNPKRSKGLFLEFGGMGTGARADKMQNSPIYANGFTVSWGYKYYL